MGLDMYANRVKKGLITEAVDFNIAENEETEQNIHYWRKHPNLHGWMESLYRKKGGQDENFNCVNVQLTEEDLVKLEKDIKEGNLPKTSGFFFGESDGTEIEDDLSFIRKAKMAIKDGYDVYYTSWC